MFALRQSKRRRRSAVIVSGRKNRIHAALIPASTAAATNGARGLKSASSPPIAGPDDEAQAERRAHQREGAAALFGRRDVGEHGVGRAVGGAGDPRDDPSGEQPADRRRDRHQRIVDREGEHREEQHRPPPDAVAQAAEHRAGEELRDRIGDEHQPARPRGIGQRHAGQLDDQRRQHRQDDAENRSNRSARRRGRSALLGGGTASVAPAEVH